MTEEIIKVKGLKKYFPLTGGIFKRQLGTVKAVDGVDISIRKGETLGIVGESGCGKTTLGKCILRLIEPTEGEIIFDGRDLLSLEDKDLKEVRKKLQIVFQDPYSSLDPNLTVRRALSIPLNIFKHVDGDINDFIIKLLRLVELREEYIDRYPHEFSGGQRQRIGIAKALTVEPVFIMLDEPTSSLDVSVQAKILNLLKKLQIEKGITYLFISHNLDVVRYMSDRIGVMYLGKIVEIASTEELFHYQLHPYTEALFSAAPVPDPTSIKTRIILTGEVPTPINPPSGCTFHPRCPKVKEKCKIDTPFLNKVDEEHMVACHLYCDSRVSSET